MPWGVAHFTTQNTDRRQWLRWDLNPQPPAYKTGLFQLSYGTNHPVCPHRYGIRSAGEEPCKPTKISKDSPVVPTQNPSV